MVPIDEATATSEPVNPAGEGEAENAMLSELQALATELDEMQGGIGPAEIEEMENAAGHLVEAFVTMKDARNRLQAVRKDRKFGNPATLASGKNNAPKAGAKYPAPADRKKDSACFDCNECGHWAGDPACQKPGAKFGRKEKQANEIQNEAHVVN